MCVKATNNNSRGLSTETSYCRATSYQNSRSLARMRAERHVRKRRARLWVLLTCTLTSFQETASFVRYSGTLSLGRDGRDNCSVGGFGHRQNQRPGPRARLPFVNGVQATTSPDDGPANAMIDWARSRGACVSEKIGPADFQSEGCARSLHPPLTELMHGSTRIFVPGLSLGAAARCRGMGMVATASLDQGEQLFAIPIDALALTSRRVRKRRRRCTRSLSLSPEPQRQLSCPLGGRSDAMLRCSLVKQSQIGSARAASRFRNPWPRSLL